MRLLGAFLLRDLRHEWSYKLSFLMQLVGTLHVLLIFFLLARLFGETTPAKLLAYGGRYFPFVLTGVAVQQYLLLSLNTYSGQLREAQLTGTFEVVLASPVPLPAYLAGTALFAFLLNTFHVLVYLGVGRCLGLSFALAQLPLVLVVLVLSAAAFASIGILSASYIVVYKRGNPLAWIFTLSSSLLAGVYYPVSILPGWVQQVAQLLPMTHCLEALRGLLLKNGGVREIAPALAGLGLWALIGLPCSYLCFAWAVRTGREKGTLGHY